MVFVYDCFVLTEFHRYESIIATLCESLDTLDEPEAKVLVIYCIFVAILIFVHLCVLISLGIHDLDNWRIC
jgi:energy-converting hydrogenase Eha subunit F